MMKRKDMDRSVMYVIIPKSYMPRPGYVLDEGKPGQPVRVKYFWTWPGDDEDWLNPNPPLHDERAKFDIKTLDTSSISGETWADYTARVKAERQAHLDKLNADQAAAEASKQAVIDRLNAVAPLIEGYDGYCDLKDLRWLIGNDRQHDSRYSAKHVLELLEYVQYGMFDSGVSQ